jgi:hypothetical protein
MFVQTQLSKNTIEARLGGHYMILNRLPLDLPPNSQVFTIC